MDPANDTDTANMTKDQVEALLLPGWQQRLDAELADYAAATRRIWRLTAHRKDTARHGRRPA